MRPLMSPWRVMSGPASALVVSQAERYGLMVMIVLGETILGQVVADRRPGIEYFVHIILGIIIAFLLHVRSGGVCIARDWVVRHCVRAVAARV